MKHGFFIFCFLLIVSCQNQDITVTRIPKEVESSLPPVSQPHTHQDQSLHWDLPSHWKPIPGSGMRVATFKVQPEKKGQAEISVVKLSGAGGDHLSNINRWRGQIGLTPLVESDLNNTMKKISTNVGEAFVVDFSSEQSRIRAAILRRSGETWFFKMTGEPEQVQKAIPDFDQFLMDLHPSTS